VELIKVFLLGCVSTSFLIFLSKNNCSIDILFWIIVILCTGELTLCTIRCFWD